MSLGDWLDERLGHRALARWFLDEPVPGGARWAYVFGSLLVFLFAQQVVTGVVMASYYAPSSTDAWASVAYFSRQVSLGWLVRGLHSAGASAMVIATVLHLLQVTIWGAYRRPREMNWYIGLVMAGVILAFALTGYLLPWDQKGYWATQVATSLVGATPLVGPWLKSVVQGGPEYGNLTLTHFYALHVIVLPAVLGALVLVHLALFRKHGLTPGWRARPAELAATTEPFWPGQLVRDLVVMTGALALMVAWVARTHGVALEAPADPASSYDARPEWYFYPLFQLLKFFPGRLEIVAAIGAPLVAGGLLFVLPLADRGPSRRPGARKAFVGAVVVLLFGAAALGALGGVGDARNPAYQRFRVRAEKDAERALRLAEAGVPPAGGLAVEENDPLARGRKVYAERCAGCHRLDGAGERRAPDLDGWSSRGWIAAFLRDPENERFYGKTKVRGMKPVKARPEDFDALVELIYSQGGDGEAGLDAAKVARGQQAISDYSCDDCHDTDGKSGGDGEPNLGGRAGVAWIRAFVSDPSEDRFFDGKNEMPKFRDKLSPADLDAVTALLRAERARTDVH